MMDILVGVGAAILLWVLGCMLLVVLVEYYFDHKDK
jgi:hypothetical protein